MPDNRAACREIYRQAGFSDAQVDLLVDRDPPVPVSVGLQLLWPEVNFTKLLLDELMLGVGPDGEATIPSIKIPEGNDEPADFRSRIP